MATPGIPGWQQQILARVGAPATPANLTFLNAWARAEGGSAANNPFNTTQPGFGATGNYNSVGVKNYASPQQGLAATVATLRNGRYGNILAALKSGQSAMAAAQALANSPWGTGSLVQKILGGGGSVSAPPPVASPSDSLASRPMPGRRIDPAALSLLNEGARLFGLPAFPAGLGSAPSRQPKPGVTPASSPASPPATQGRESKPPVVKGSSLRWLEHHASPFGLTITSTTGGKHAKNSYHYRSRAVDLAGSPQSMAAAANYALQHPDQFSEMFYTGPGHPDYFISGGKVLPLSQLDKGLYEEHTNHVHWAR